MDQSLAHKQNFLLPLQTWYVPRSSYFAKFGSTFTGFCNIKVFTVEVAVSYDKSANLKKLIMHNNFCLLSINFLNLLFQTNPMSCLFWYAAYVRPWPNLVKIVYFLYWPSWLWTQRYAVHKFSSDNIVFFRVVGCINVWTLNPNFGALRSVKPT